MYLLINPQTNHDGIQKWPFYIYTAYCLSFNTRTSDAMTSCPKTNAGTSRTTEIIKNIFFIKIYLLESFEIFEEIGFFEYFSIFQLLFLNMLKILEKFWTHSCLLIGTVESVNGIRLKLYKWTLNVTNLGTEPIEMKTNNALLNKITMKYLII